MSTSKTGEHLITGRDIIVSLCDLVGEEPNRIRRIVIDIAYDDIPLIYVEKIGDSRLLKISSSLEGIRIENVQGEQHE